MTKKSPMNTNQTQQYHSSDRQLKFMADSMPQLVWITRPDGFHEYYNQRWYEFTGTKPGSTDGEGWNDLFHPNDQARAMKRWKHSLETGEKYEIEYRLYHRKSGAYKWVIGRARPYYDEDGAIEKWYGTCTDINDQKRAEKRQKFLSEATKQLNESLDYEATIQKVSELCVPDIADWCTVDLYDKVEGFTQVSMAHADPKKHALASQYRQDHPLTIDESAGVPAVIKSGKTEFTPHITQDDITAVMEPGPDRDFMLSLHLRSAIIVPIKINHKNAGALSLIVSDSGYDYSEVDLELAKELALRISIAITNSMLYSDSLEEVKHRKSLEKQLILEKQKLESRVKERTAQLNLTNQGLRDEILRRREAEEELTRSNKELEDFAYVASHDLQEPLRKIQAFGDLLESEYKESLGEGADYLARIKSASSRMSTLIQDLLTFSRVATRVNPPEPVDLNETVTAVIDDLESRIDDHGGKVTFGELPTVIADPTHMRQLFQNLIGNALKFHRPDVNPMVHIDERTGDDSYFEITVCDNGIGFDEKYLDRIFSVFQRLHGREEYEGTGIGLAVCRKIVEQYDGTITAETKKDKGSTFIIKLPKYVAFSSIKETKTNERS